MAQITKLFLGLILIIDILYMVYLPIVFQKGGVEQGQLQGLFVLILGNVFIYSFRLNIKRIWERMLLVLIPPMAGPVDCFLDAATRAPARATIGVSVAAMFTELTLIP